jgi:hypothetical protein
MESLRGCHIDSVSQRSDDKPWTVSEVLVTVAQTGISNAELEVVRLSVVQALELFLPQEVILVAATTVSHVANHVTRVRIHSDETHELGTQRLVDSRTSDHHNETIEVLNLLVVALLHGIFVSSLMVEERLLAVDDPLAVVQKQDDLRGSLLNPCEFITLAHLLEVFKREVFQ